MKMKRKVVPILCALFLSAMASNGASALTKQGLKADLETMTFNVEGTEKKLSRDQLQKASKFLDECGELNANQYAKIEAAISQLGSVLNKRAGMTLEQINKDPSAIQEVNEIISGLRNGPDAIEGLNVTLEEGKAFCGTIELNGATLPIDLSDVKNLVDGSSQASSNSKSTTGTTGTTSATGTTSKNSDKSKSSTSSSSKSSKTIKSTGTDVDFSALSLTATASLLSIAAGILMARKKNLFEGE